MKLYCQNLFILFALIFLVIAQTVFAADSSLSFPGWLNTIDTRHTFNDTAYVFSLFQSAKQFDSKGNYDSAAVFYEKAANTYLQLSLHKRYVDCLNELIIKHSILRNVDKSMQWAQILEAFVHKNYGKSHFLTAKSYSSIALAFIDNDDVDTAKAYIYKSLRLLDRRPDHIPLRIKNYSRLSNVFDVLEIPDSVLVYSQKTIDLTKKMHGNNHPDLALYYYHLAEGYMDLAKYEKAFTFFYNAYQIDIQHVGRIHPNIAMDLYSMAVAMDQAGNSSKAIKFLNRAVDIYRKTAGERSYNMALCYNALGTIYYKKGDYDRAGTFMQRSLDIKRTILGDDHSSIALARHNLACVYCKNHKETAALRLNKKALRVFLTKLGETHPMVAGVYNNMGVCYKRLQAWSNARNCFDKAVEIYKNHKSASDIIETWQNLGDIYLIDGNLQAALTSYTRALEKSIQLFQKNHPVIVNAYYRLGLFHQEQKNFRRALQCYQAGIINACHDFSNSDWTQNPRQDDIIYHRKILPLLCNKAIALTQQDAVSNYANAMAAYKLSFHVLDKVRIDYPTQASKMAIGDRFADLHDFALKAAILGYAQNADSALFDAFYFAEKRRANVLWETLSKIKSRQMAGIADSVLNRGRTLREKIVHFDVQLAQHLKKTASDSARVAGIRKTLFDCQTQYYKWLQQLERNFPRYYEYKYRLSIANLQTL